MLSYYVVLLASIVLNVGLLWYLTRLLKKFYFVSETLADLYLTARAFQVFVANMYSMDSYHGEPMIQELMLRIKDVVEEVDNFRDVFQYSLDEVLEEELNASEEEE